MPFTRAYTEQLTELSAEITTALNALFNESLAAFAEDTGVRLNHNLRFNLLLNKRISDLDETEQGQLRGENKNEHGSRQRLLALRQAWNEILHLHQSILNGELKTQKALSDHIDAITATFKAATVKFIKEIFPEHEFTERKINFVTSFIGVAHQLLKKQHAVQALLATNVTRDIERHIESPMLQKTKEAYDQKVSAHNQAWATNVKQHEIALNTLEKKHHDISGVRLALLDKKEALSNANDTMNEHTTNLALLEKTLKDLVNTTVDNNATIESLTARDTELETAATELLAGINAYKINVIECTASTAENTNTFIVHQNEALDALENAAHDVCKAQPLDERGLKISLAALDPLYNALCREIDEEIKQLEARLAFLTALNIQHNTDNTHAKQALAAHLPTLAKQSTDTTALTTFKDVCAEQHDFFTIGSTPWTRLKDFTTTQFDSINAFNETNQGVSQSQTPEAILDTSSANTIAQALTETNSRLEQLRKNKVAITHQHNEQKKQGTAALNHGTETVKEQINDLLIECEKITDALIAFNGKAAVETRMSALTQARETLRSVNQKRRNLLAQINSLQPIRIEVDYLTQRIAMLKQKFDENPFSIEEDLHPDALQAALKALPINLSLLSPTPTKKLQKLTADTPLEALQKFTADTPLNALRKKVDLLDEEMTRANKSYHYRRKGTFIGGMVGGALGLALLGGLVASIVFSFGLALPITIGVGVAIATSPALFAGIGRLFGWRKDKTVTKQMIDKNNNDRLETQSEISRKNRNNTLTREQSMKSQLSVVEATEEEIENYLQKAKAPQTKQPLTRRRTTIRQSQLYGSGAFQYPIPGPFISTADLRLGSSVAPKDDTVAPSFDPESERNMTSSLNRKSVHFAEDPSSSSEASPSFEAVPETTLRTLTPPINANDASESEPEAELEDTPEPTPYSMYKGGDFGLFSISYTSTQQTQGEAREAVVAKANRV